MNKKRAFSLLALALVLAVGLTALVACNTYKWHTVAGGDASAPVTSNGGYFVKQGEWAYFINGFVGDNDANGWGTPFKQSIFRAKMTADGKVDNSTAERVVPKSIYNKSVNGGFAVFGQWIYYATPNNDEDKSGTPSTTHTDFMRTRIDGKYTQLIGTINSRESEFLFTPTRVLYRTDTKTVSYFDFSGMKSDKNIDNGKGVKSGTLIENATSIIWNYDAVWNPGQGSVVSDYIFYTEQLTGDNSYEFYNNLYAIKYDGSGKTLLANNTSYLTEDEAGDYVNHPDKVFNFSLVDSFVENDDTVTLYYTKAINLNSTSTSRGLYCNTFSMADGFSVAKEKQLTALEQTTIFPLGYEKGALVSANSKYSLVDGSSVGSDDVYANVIIGRAATVQAVIGDYVYYTDSTADKLYRINLKTDTGSSPNETAIMSEKLKTDWLNLEFDGSVLYFFATDGYSYVHYVDVAAFDGKDQLKSEMIGKMTDADAAAKAEADKKAEEEANNNK